MPNGTDGLRFFDLSHPSGHDAPLWPYFPDVKIERFHNPAKSGVLSQQITTFMHCTTHTDAPAHAIEGTEFKYLSRFLPSLYIADHREDEPVELPW